MTTRTFSAILRERARTDPDEPLVADADGILTARDLDAAATGVAIELVERGIRRDDTVAVSLPNGRDFVVACFGVWRAGATPQPLSPALTAQERHELERVALPVAAIGAPPSSSAVSWMPRPPAAPRAGVLPDLAASCWKAPATSGSTGRPKIVRAAAPATLDPDRPVAAFLPRGATQLVAGPLWHSAVFTYAFRGLLTGHRLVVMDRFDAADWIALVERHRATWGLLVPTMMARLLRLPEEERAPERVSSIERILHMGAPCAPALKRAFIDWIGADRVDEVYAGSESNGLTRITGTEWLARPGSVGRPIGGTRVRIRADDGTDLPTGEAGLVWMHRGDTAAYAYLGAPSRRDDDGWDTLGDIGHVDADGYLFLHDRADDLINRGGDKIAPAVVEAALEAHPAVVEAVAFGVADDELGQSVHAVVRLEDGPGVGRAVLDDVRRRLGSRAPVALHVVADPLRNDAGKVRRRALAERYGPG